MNTSIVHTSLHSINMHTCVTVVASLISSHNPISAYSRKHAASSFAYFAIVMDKALGLTHRLLVLYGMTILTQLQPPKCFLLE
jgi:hypothetical protein